MKLGDIPVPKGATHRSKRRGLGESSGHGKTSGRGHKGQRSRSGHGIRPGFEGGQMPLIRRIPKRGFNHPRQYKMNIINLHALNRFPAGSEVSPETLKETGLLHWQEGFVKVLGDGELAHPLKVKAHQFSKSAGEKILRAGGTIEKLGCNASC